MRLEDRDEFGGQCDGALALALRLAEGDASAVPLRAVGGVLPAVPWTRLRAGVLGVVAVWRAVFPVLVPVAATRARRTVESFAAGVRVVAAVPPVRAAELPPDA